MKIKEIDRTANVAWSPASQHPIYLAAGTAAQQLDATFSTSAALDIYTLNLSEPGQDMELVGTMPSDSRFHKLVWGASKINGTETPSGLLMGGADNGNLFVWNPDKLIQKEDPLVYKLDKHVGAVAALDVNPFQTNLIASGASESEIYLWDLNNPSNPMTPGSKSQPPDDVTCLAWNQQVQHILASTYSGRCVVWDLRKNEPIIKVSDSMTRIKCKLVAWHPETATQLCLASEDDHTPVIQLWDLRFATSPLKVLENHQRGILSVAWCPQDPDLLLSCGKDNRILCWNPNSQAQAGEVVYELPTSNQWSFDVQWCPRNPAVISSCSFDGHISIYSLMGGRMPAQAPTANKIADSFPSDPFAQTTQQPQPEEQETVVLLKKPPRWLRRPCGATFGFGGKLVSFEQPKPANPQQAVSRQVLISQVVTETELVTRSNQLESALQNGQFSEFCSLKIANSQTEMEESIWNFLKVNFEQDPRLRYLQILGYDQTDLSKKVTTLTGSEVTETSLEDIKQGVDASELAQKMAMLNSGTSSLPAPTAGSGQTSPYIAGPETPGSEGVLAPEGSAAFDQIAQQENDSSRSDSPLTITVDDECDGLVTQALLTANFEAAVEVCVHNGRLAEAVILAIAGGPELLARTQKKIFQKNSGNLNRLISSVVTKDFEHVIRTCEIDNWKEALAMALTYAKGENFASLCDILGSRLESERGGVLAANACLCYICAGNVDRLVECWSRLDGATTSPAALQDLVEKVMVLKRAVELARGQVSEVSGGPLADKLSQYSELLAAQGSLQTAINYLGNSSEVTLAVLRDRLYCALGQATTAKPFQMIDVQAEGVRQQIQQPQIQQQQPQAQAQQPNQRQRTNSGFYQTQAGTFQTTTTPTSTYYSQSQQYVSGFGQTQPMTTFSQQQNLVSSSAAAGALSKGPLSQKYPVHPQASTGYDPYSQPGYNPGAYNNPQYTPPGAGFSTSQASSVSSQPQIYDPTAAAAAAQQTPDHDILGSSTSSLDQLRAISGFSSGMLKSMRRSSKAYEDTESIAGVLGSMSPRRGSIQQETFNLDHERLRKSSLTGAPYAPSNLPASVSGAADGSNIPSYQENKPVQAWNDPPILQGKKKAEPAPYKPQPAITQPIFGVPQDQGPPGGPSYSGATSNLYNPQQYQQQQQQQQQQQAAAPPPEPPKPVEKAPIPAEHKILQEILQSMTNQCMSKATNPQMKRKLEDVLKKLETLYDRLREQTLSQNVLLGLHQIIQSIQQYDYQTGLAYHTQMISQGNFSEISSFMPGIKILLQLASQLQVYVQQ